MQHLHSLAFAFGLDFAAEDKFRSGFVHARLVFEITALIWFIDRPAGENIRNFGYVALRIAAIDAERVQFHQLTTIIFVESAGALPLIWPRAHRVTHAVWTIRMDRNSESLRRVGTNAQPVIEIKKHRRTFRRCN